MANDPADGHHLVIEGDTARCTCDQWEHHVFVTPATGDVREDRLKNITEAHARHLGRLRDQHHWTTPEPHR